MIKWLFEVFAKRRQVSAEVRGRAENTGVLLASGFIAGESLMAVILALLVIGRDFLPLPDFNAYTFGVQPQFLLSLLAYPVMIYLLAWFTINKAQESDMPATHLPE